MISLIILPYYIHAIFILRIGDNRICNSVPANPNKEMADKDVFGPVDPSCLFYNNNKQ